MFAFEKHSGLQKFTIQMRAGSLQCMIGSKNLDNYNLESEHD